MAKTAKRSIILSAVLAIVMCASLIAGATFAIFTSESKVNIAVTSGKVKVEATIDNIEVYSPTSISMDSRNSIVDGSNAANDSYNEDSAKTFANGGTATLDGGTLKLDKMTPGDKVTFDIKIKNESNVKAMYRTVYSYSGDALLFSGLKITIDEEEYIGGNTVMTSFADLSAGEMTVKVAVELPTDAGNVYQDRSCEISYKVEAVQGNVFNGIYEVNAGNIQDYLDGKYGSLDGATLVLAEGDYGKLELGRATAYAGSNTVYYNTAAGFSGTPVTLEEFTANHNYRYYIRSMSNVTFKAAEGAVVSIAGLEMKSGHIHGTTGSPSKDYVIGDSTEDSNNSYNLAHKVSNLSFENLNFTAQCSIQANFEETEITGVTFSDCTFNIGNTADGYQAIIYKANSDGTVKSKVSNLVVKNCTFTNCFQGVYTQHVKGVTVTDCEFDHTGHNAIAIQADISFNHGLVVITNNTFTNIGNRIIRFGHVGADTQIIIKNNTASNYDLAAGETMKAESLADGITYEIKNNSWAAEGVANEELKDQD